MATVIKPPTPLPDGTAVFLAGSIEMGTAVDWQAQVEAGLAARNVLIFNPRRDDWDASWRQEKSHPQFHQQVTWELDALEKAAVIAMYFAPQTKAPISLLELGLFAQSGKLIVCCPAGFWRKGNVDIVCERHHIPQVETLAALIKAVGSRLRENDKSK